MKSNIVPAIIAPFILSSVYSEVGVGDFGALGFGVESSVRHTSNVLLDSAETEDTIFSVLPTLNFRSDEGAASINAFVGIEFLRYRQLSKNDSNNFKSGVTITLPDEADGGNYSLVLAGGFNQTTSASAALQQVTETEELALSADGRYFLSEYVELRSGVSYKDSVSKTTGFADIATAEIPIALYYKYDETLSAGLGYRYRSTDVTGVTPEGDSSDHAVFFGFEDLISPLIQYEVKVGYQYRDFDNDVVFDDGGGPLAQLSLTWFLSDLTQVVGSISNEFSTSAANQSSETFSTSVTVYHALDTRISLSGGLKYDEVDYDQVVGTRLDEDTSVFVNLNYAVDEDKFVIRTGLSYADHTSDVAAANYEAIEFTLGATLLY